VATTAKKEVITRTRYDSIFTPNSVSLEPAAAQIFIDRFVAAKKRLAEGPTWSSVALLIIIPR